MKKYQQINRQRRNRAYRVSNTVKQYSDRPRLCVFRSNAHIYAQIIDDEHGKTLASAGTMDKDLKKSLPNGGNCTAAEKVGATIASKALAAGITKVAFDRHGFKYHGRVKALADAARGAGLDIGAAGEAKQHDAGEGKGKEAPKKPKASKEDKVAAKVAAGKADSAKKTK
jgi:large subunit ribosomal protein L18